MSLKPFWCYYGGKFRAAPHYPAPKYNTIIEPFAGAAGYSLRHYQRNIILCEADPLVANLWAYLIRVSAEEIRRIPTGVGHVDEVPGPQEARHLVGFWFNKGTERPYLTPSRWMRDNNRPNSFWGEVIRERIATQVDKIRHWKVRYGSYVDLANQQATWFVDPPYDNDAGKRYKHQIEDYTALGAWCRTRQGQTIVCENVGASWLPFTYFKHTKSLEGAHGKARSAEAIWVSNDDAGNA